MSQDNFVKDGWNLVDSQVNGSEYVYLVYDRLGLNLDDLKVVLEK